MSSVSRLTSSFSPLFFALLLASCVSGKVVGGLYIDEARGFKVPFLQEGWRRIELDEVELAFRDEAEKATIALFRSCKDDRAPLKVLARQLLFGFKDRRILEQRALSLNGAEAIQMILQGRLEGEEVKVSSYVVQGPVLSRSPAPERSEGKGEVEGPGCLYDLVYFARPEAFDKGLDDFEGFVKGLELLGGP